MRTSSLSSRAAIRRLTRRRGGFREARGLAAGGVEHVPAEGHHGRDAQRFQDRRVHGGVAGQQLELAARAGQRWSSCCALLARAAR